MIQTVEQYVFLYRSLIEGILSFGTNITLQEFTAKKSFPVDIKSQYKVFQCVHFFRCEFNRNILFSTDN